LAVTSANQEPIDMTRPPRLISRIAHLVRRALGLAGLGLRLDAMQSQLGRIEGLIAPAAAAAPPGPSYVSLTLPGGQAYELSIPSATSDAFLQAVASGETRDATWRLVIGWLEPGDVFFDLGSNVGTFSIPAAVLGAEVHAFELLHENASHIARAAEKNALKRLSITLGAISDRPGCVGFGGYSAWGAVYVDMPVSVATITMDDYAHQKQIGRVDFMKIDVEGSEKWALRGASKLLDRDRPDIVIECNVIACGNNGYSYHDLLSFLADRRYSLYRLYGGRLCPWKPDAVQEVVYADYFASVKTPDEIRKRSGCVIAEMTQAEIVESLVEQDRFNEYHKAYVLANQDRLPSFVFSDGRVPALLQKWDSLKDRPFFQMLKTGSAPAAMVQ
jgi:FkbM family methyltransferase